MSKCQRGSRVPFYLLTYFLSSTYLLACLLPYLPPRGEAAGAVRGVPLAVPLAFEHSGEEELEPWWQRQQSEGKGGGAQAAQPEDELTEEEAVEQPVRHHGREEPA